jgi:hypothetical protein
MNSHSDGDLDACVLLELGIQLPDRRYHSEASPHRPLGIILMRQGIAEVDQQAIAEILRDVALEALDDLGTGLLIGAHPLAVVFRVELAGEHGRVHEVAEQHRKLAAFRVRRRKFVWCQAATDGLVFLCTNLLRRCDRCYCRCHVAGPDQDLSLLIYRELLGIDQVVLERFQNVVIEMQSEFEDAIGEAFLPLK